MTTATLIPHPAKYSPAILDVLVNEVYFEAQRRRIDPSLFRTLDPMAGVGRVHQLPGITVGLEIEPEWAGQNPGTIVGNATDMPFLDESFDAIVVSPCYGNRLSDSHTARDGSKRHSYTHTLGRKVTKGSSGDMPFRNSQSEYHAYRSLHRNAWREAIRVLKPGGMFVLNVSDFIAGGEVQNVSAWHVNTLRAMGLRLERQVDVATQRLRHGTNRDARVLAEHVFRLRKGLRASRKDANGTEISTCGAGG